MSIFGTQKAAIQEVKDAEVSYLSLSPSSSL